MAINVGIDFCDDYLTAYEISSGTLIRMPAVVCREKKTDVWHIGQEAYRLALSGTGVMTDRLLSMAKKGGVSTIRGKAYTALELITYLFSTLISELLMGKGPEEIDYLTIALLTADRELMDVVRLAAENTGLAPERIDVISHQEAFICYTLTRDKALYNNTVALFDLSEERLSYYELKVIRGMRVPGVIAEGGEVEESFHTDILSKDSGSKLGDRIITDVAQKHMANGIYSCCMLTGTGFERTDWANSFFDYICRRRKVIYEAGLFAIGAGIHSEQQGAEQMDYTIFCDTKLVSDFSMEVMIGERKSKLILARAGQSWYRQSAHVEVLPKAQRNIEIYIEPVSKFDKKRVISMDMEGFPERPDRCTRVAVDLYFVDASTLNIRLTDLGFGEIYPKSGYFKEETVRI